MDYRKKVLRGDFAITGEIAPRKGVDPKGILSVADLLKDDVDAINVTDNQRACVRTSSLAASRILYDNDIEPIYQLTCRDRNSIGLQSDLLGAHMLGLRNILALTGDHPASGDHPNAKPVYDLDSTQLIKTIMKMNQGVDLEDNKLDEKTDFFIGAAFNPGCEDEEVELLRIKRKLDAGAMFFQTQVVYDIDAYRDFIKQASGKIRVLVGIVPLKSKRMAEFMNEKIPGVKVPESLINEIGESSNPVETGIEQASDLIRQIKPYCAGIHLMALGSEKHVHTILEKAGII